MLTEPHILSVCNVYELFYIKTIFDEWFCNNQLVHQFVLYLIQIEITDFSSHIYNKMARKKCKTGGHQTSQERLHMFVHNPPALHTVLLNTRRLIT